MSSDKKAYGSDEITQVLKSLGIEYIAYNPGATVRGIQDSVMNLQNKEIELILCCHEQIAVSIAHGYAKASGKYMAVLLHSNVGLLNASMAIFNAWCDRVPILIINGCGPMDSEKRRPWIDWIHTSNSQGSVVREFVKWYDQPSSIGATKNTLNRAHKYLNLLPKAPVLVCIDTKIQEENIENVESVELSVKSQLNLMPQASEEWIEKTAEMLIFSRFPIIIVDYTGSNENSRKHLEEIANLLAIPVIDCGGRYNLSSDNYMYHIGENKEIIEQADFILALDVMDLAALLNKEYFDNKKCEVYHVSMNDALISNWSADYQNICLINKNIMADTSVVLPSLLKACKQRVNEKVIDKVKRRFKIIQNSYIDKRNEYKKLINELNNNGFMQVPNVLYGIWESIKEENFFLTNPGSYIDKEWIKKLWTFTQDDFYIGASGGAGLGYGIGASIGAALAMKDKNKICIDIQSDGDLLFMPSALWTLAHYRVPLLVIIMNNKGYGNTKMHAKKISEKRNRTIFDNNTGSELESPTVDFIEMANSYGIKTIGIVDKISDLSTTIKRAIYEIKKNKIPVLLEIKMD